MSSPGGRRRPASDSLSGLPELRHPVGAVAAGGARSTRPQPRGHAAPAGARHAARRPQSAARENEHGHTIGPATAAARARYFEEVSAAPGASSCRSLQRLTHTPAACRRRWWCALQHGGGTVPSPPRTLAHWAALAADGGDAQRRLTAEQVATAAEAARREREAVEARRRAALKFVREGLSSSLEQARGELVEEEAEERVPLVPPQRRRRQQPQPPPLPFQPTDSLLLESSSDSGSNSNSHVEREGDGGADRGDEIERGVVEEVDDGAAQHHPNPLRSCRRCVVCADTSPPESLYVVVVVVPVGSAPRVAVVVGDGLVALRAGRGRAAEAAAEGARGQRACAGAQLVAAAGARGRRQRLHYHRRRLHPRGLVAGAGTLAGARGRPLRHSRVRCAQLQRLSAQVSSHTCRRLWRAVRRRRSR